MRSLLPQALLLALLALPCAPGGADAQGRVREFEKITVGFGLLMQVNTTPVDKGWEPGAGLECYLETPFYLGVVQGGIQLLPYSTIRSDLPEYDSRFLYLDWRMPLRPSSRIRWSNGFRIGILQMDFDDPSATWHDRVDHELGLGLVSALDWEVLDGWSVRVTAVHRKIFISKPVEQTILHLSIGRSFSTPRWLLEFLR